MPSRRSGPETGDVLIEQVPYDDARAVALRGQLDAMMHERYPHTSPIAGSPRAALLQDVYAVKTQDVLVTVLISDPDGTPVAQGALRHLDGELEVKRVVVDAQQRGRGLGAALMTELERLARAQGAERVVLQCGKRQPEAVALYTGRGYTPIEVYAPYAGVTDSLCFELTLAAELDCAAPATP